MKKIFTLLVLATIINLSYAQLPNGSNAPNWTMNDIEGTSHTLYDYLDQGYGVIIDFSATWCGPCWNYHNTQAMKNLWNEHGPNATNEAYVFYIEGDGNTQTSCLYGPAGSCPNNTSTQGNWVNGTPYPIIDNNSQNGPYSIAFYPTIYGVCPTNTVQSREIELLGQRNKEGLYNFISGCVTTTFDVAKSNVSCYGEETGSIEITLKSGRTPMTVNWSNGATGTTVSNLPPGTYTCTITNGNGETTVSNPIVINGPTSPVSIVPVNIVPENCSGNNGIIQINVSGGTSGYTYFWNNFSQSQNQSNLISGEYAVTVTDANGCVYTSDIYEVDRREHPVAQATVDGALDCIINSLLLDGSGSSEGSEYSYLWWTTNGNIVSGENTLNPEVDGIGTYFLSVSDDTYGCLDQTTVDVAGDQTPPNTNAGANTSIPCGGGDVVLNGSGDSGSNFIINWSTQNGNIVSGENTLTPTINAPGNYMLTIVSLLTGCVGSDVTEVNALGGFDMAVNSQNESEEGAEDGSISLNITGGTAPFQYSWSNGSTAPSLTGLPAGVYSVTVTDANGCVENATVIIINESCILVADVESTQNATCYGLNNGSVTIEVTTSVGEVTVLWPDGGEGLERNDLAAGNYQIIVVDENGCPKSLEFNIEQPEAIEIALVEVPVFECSTNNGEIGVFEVIAEGGQGNIQYRWSNNATGSRIEAEFGIYTVEVIDENGCISSLEIIPGVSDDVAPVIFSKDIRVSLDKEGQILVPALWVDNGSYDNCEIESYGLSKDLFTCDDLGIQTVLFIVEDFNGNQSQKEVEIEVIDDLAPEISCPGNIIVRSSDPVIRYTDPAHSDNCEVVLFELLEGLPSGSEFPLGETQMTFIAIDQSGNETLCSFTITRLKPSRKDPFEADKGIFDVPVIRDPLPFTGENPQGIAAKIKNEDVLLYPNPVNNELYMEISLDNEATVSYQIFDLYGKIVQNQNLEVNTFSRFKIDTYNLTSGVYFMQININENTYTKKVIVQK